MTTLSSTVTIAAPRWPLPIRLFHWITALSMLTVLAAILGREAFEDKPLRALLMLIHQHAGLLVLSLTALRLLVRVRTPRPDIAISRAAAAASAVGHGLLYLGLLAMPLLGWALASAHGHPPVFLGLQLPALVEHDRDVADSLHEWHETLGWTMVAIAALHACAALWHHLVKRDAVLRAMV